MKGRIFPFLLLFIIAPGISASAENARTGVITGLIRSDDGAPMSGGRMVFFRVDSGPPPSPGRYFRVPDEVVPIDTNGSFAANLPEGRYYASAIRKRAMGRVGPPVDGDQVFPSPADLAAGKSLYAARMGETTDIGTVTAVRFQGHSTGNDGPVTAIRGTVTDPEGNPVPGAIALAFPSPSVAGKPLFISEITGEDGIFLLRVDGGGAYYIKIRTSLRGGHPEEMETVGAYGGEKPTVVRVNTGEVVNGIDIRGRKFSGGGNNRSTNGRPL